MDIQPTASLVQVGRSVLPDSPNLNSSAPANAATASATAATPAVTAATPAVTAATAAPTAAQLAEAVKSINKTMATLAPGLEFSVDQDTQTTVVKVIDMQTKEVIRQVPSQETMDIAKALDQVLGLLIRDKA